MLFEGLIIMVVGMSVVFAFLLIMVELMQIMSGVINRYYPDKPEPQSSASAGGDDVGIAIAIAMAYSRSE